MHDGDQDCHAEIGLHKSACCLLARIGTVKAQIEQYQHQPGAMRDREGERPWPQFGLCLRAPVDGAVDEPEEAEPDEGAPVPCHQSG